MYMALFTTNSNNYNNHNFASTINHLSFLRTESTYPFSMHAHIRAYFALECNAMSLWCIPKAGFIDTKTDTVMTILTS